ncbi:MAG: hypothetical protein ACE5IL_02360 [Myxococcota bacterium]
MPSSSLSLLSSTASLRQKLEVKLGSDGELELDLQARLRTQTLAQLELGGPEGAVQALAKLSESITLRIHLEIQADATPGGLRDALQQLASGFRDALDSLAGSFASKGDTGGAGETLVSRVRDAFASLLDGLRPAFEGQTGPAAPIREPNETREARAHEREAGREADERPARPRSEAPGGRHGEPAASLDRRFVRLRSDLQDRFARGLEVLLQSLEGRSFGSPPPTPPAEAASSGAPALARAPARSAFELQLSRRQEVRFRLIERRV